MRPSGGRIEQLGEFDFVIERGGPRLMDLICTATQHMIEGQPLKKRKKKGEIDFIIFETGF